MNKHKSQQGSGLLAIVIILAVALLGAVGYIFWQNFSNTAEINKDSSANVSDVVLNKIAYDKTLGTDMAVRYPETWSMEHKASGPNSYGRYDDTSTITSPDGEIEVVLYVFQPTGFGQNCADDSLTQILDEGTINSYESLGYKAYAEGSVFPDGSTHYKYYFGAYKLDVINDTTCKDYSYGRYIMSLPGHNSSDGVPIIYMRFPNIEDETTSYDRGYNISNIDDLKQIIKTNNYKIAKQIIQSLHKM